MSQLQAQTIPREKFLLIATNLLHQAFLASSRTDAKNIFKELCKGASLGLTTVEMEDNSTVRFDAALDSSEYRGKINFGAFRASLKLLVANLARELNEKKEIKVFEAEHDNNVVVFGVSAATQEEGETNVMVLAADPGSAQAVVLLRLMYLDYRQFVEQAGEEVPA